MWKTHYLSSCQYTNTQGVAYHLSWPHDILSVLILQTVSVAMNNTITMYMYACSLIKQIVHIIRRFQLTVLNLMVIV